MLNPMFRNKNIKKLMPYHVNGNVLSLVASNANNRIAPLINTTSWKDMSKFNSTCNFTNLTGTSSSGFNKVLTSNGKGFDLQYTTLAPNADFSTSTNGVADQWAMSVVASKSVSNGIQSFLVNVQYRRFAMLNKITVTPGERYYGRASINATSNQIVFSLSANNESVNRGLKAHSGSGTFENLSTIGTMQAGDTNLVIRVEDDRASNWDTIQVKTPILINLTTNTYVQMLEASLGRNLTVDECDRLFAFTTTSSNVIIDIQYALSLDGSDDYGTVTNAVLLDIINTEFAFAFTFRPTIGAPSGILFSKGYDTALNTQYFILYDTANKRVQLYLNGTIVLSTTNNSILENSWNHILFYRDSFGLISSFINNVANNTLNDNSVLVSQPYIRIGARTNNTSGTGFTSLFKGDIATISIYSLSVLNLNLIKKAEINATKNYINNLI